MENVVPFKARISSLKKGDMKADRFREQIVRPSLMACGMHSIAAENLMLGTALAESGLDTLVQFGGGPALSFYQIEPSTYDDVVKYINRRFKRKEEVLSALYVEMLPPSDHLIWNMRLATIIARTIYWRKPEPLPAYDDIYGLAQYWKLNYNTVKGKGTVEHFVRAWENVYD